jgi:Rrf2 family protein
MKMSEGVEWALHSCLNLAWVGQNRAVTAAQLAAFYDLPAAYFNKQLQALARAGIVSSTPGPQGGFRLARAPERITLLDVVLAIEGPEPPFRCTEIRQRGPGAQAPENYVLPCAIAHALGLAERVWHQALAGQTIADVKAEVERTAPEAPETTRRWFESQRA